MTDNRYVAAVEVSSSKIIATVGSTDGAGHLDVLAVEQLRGLESVRFGIVQNAEETSSRLMNIIDRLESRPELSGRTIEAVYVGLGGRSMCSIEAQAELRLPEETEITAAHVRELESQARHWPVDASLEVVDVVPRSYRVGNTDTQDPVGMLCSEIHATFDLIVCRRQLKKNITHTIEGKTDLKIAGFIITPVAVSHLILSQEQKRLGCMLVDMGAETTTVMIFKNNHIQYFNTLPMGSRNITRDIISLNFLEERAEEIKKSSGCATASSVPTAIDVDGVLLSDINNRIVARSEEIVANIIEQIHYAGLSNGDLPGGIVAIGGGFKLSGMIDLLTTRSKLSVCRGTLPTYVNIDDAKAPSSEVIEVASVLYAGATLSDEECLSHRKVEELPQVGEDVPDEDVGPEGEERKQKVRRPGKFAALMGRVKRARDKASVIFLGDKDNPEDDPDFE